MFKYKSLLYYELMRLPMSYRGSTGCFYVRADTHQSLRIVEAVLITCELYSLEPILWNNY